MIERDQKIYGFWDGDFTFHVPVYNCEDPQDRRRDIRGDTFRVRINQDPQERAQANVTNPNRMPPGWKEIAPATDRDAVVWIDAFQTPFPLRAPVDTEMLRRLRLQGSVDINDGTLHPMKRSALRRLLLRRRFFRDFKVARDPFAQQKDGVYTLTDSGMWLTGLMK